MKVGIAGSNGKVSQHFGHSKELNVFKISDNKVSFLEKIEVQEHVHKGFPQIVLNADIDVLICGNLGAGAVQKMENENIEVITGASGDINETIELYAKGELVSKDLQCEGHSHDHDHEHGHCHD